MPEPTTFTTQVESNSAQHRALAIAAANRQDFRAAITHMLECCRLAPGSIEYHFQLGSLLAHTGNHEQALPYFRLATTHAPDFVDGWWFLGKSLVLLGRGIDARAPLRKALSLQPDNPRLLRDLAMVEFSSGFPEDALPLWKRILDLDPTDLDAILKTGESLSRLGYHRDATAHYRMAASNRPTNPDLWMALGQSHEDESNRDAAQEAYERALELKPGWTFPIASLIELRRGLAHEKWVAQATQKLASPESTSADRALLGFALGKFHDAKGNYQEAFNCWEQANIARQRMIGPSDPRGLIQRTERTLAEFQPGSIVLSRNSGLADERPVFIVGMPRSGTTLTEQIIASHPLAHGCGELPDLVLIARDLASQYGSDLQWPEIATKLGATVLSQSGHRYLTAATRHAFPEARRLVDKAPLNCFHLGLAAMLLPSARIIWCRRDPRDIAISVFGENFSLEEKLATSLEGIGHYINQQHRMMRHWQTVLKLPILELQYEQLVTDLESQSRRIVNFIELPWNAACLNFHDNGQSVQTASRWQVKQPVHTRSVGRWRNYRFALDPLLQVLDADAYTDLPAGFRD